MPPTLEELGIDKLSADDRVARAEAILESVVRESEAADVKPWEAVKASITTCFPPRPTCDAVPDWHWPILREWIAEADANPGIGEPLCEAMAVLRRTDATTTEPSCPDAP